ncbi:MAG: hypothetical protein QXQ76_06425, partial [Candidatus Bathyarchaeia archaeon]
EKKIERLKALRSKGTKRAKEAARKLAMKIKLMKATKDYNLRTSLKSYIDPRVYYEWGRKVGLDWKSYYPKALQRKFSWLDSPPEVFQSPSAELSAEGMAPSSPAQGGMEEKS